MPLLSCVLLSFVSDVAYLCCWMLRLLLVLSLTVILRQISLDVADVTSFIHPFMPFRRMYAGL